MSQLSFGQIPDDFFDDRTTRNVSEPVIDNALSASQRRWAWLEINRSAIAHNVNELRRFTGRSVDFMAVVKADGYGHGAIESAKAAKLAGASWFGVSNIDEAIILRNAGLNEPVFLLAQPPQDTIPLLLKHDVTPAVYTAEFALALGETADRLGVCANYHLAINSGMNRIGVRHDEVLQFLEGVAFHRALKLSGTFTHFATADEKSDWDLKLQYQKFTAALEAMRSEKINPGIVHAANSAATIRYPATHFDMVRCGIAIYGLHPSDVTKGAIDLRPAMSVKSRISAINIVPVGEGVSYGLRYISPGNVEIATVPIGYADGIPRILSGKLDVLHRGKLRPQVGTITMDQMMFEIDLKGTAKNPAGYGEIGDDVVIVGESDNLEITMDHLAKKLGTINYELACRFGMRLEREYI